MRIWTYTHEICVQQIHNYYYYYKNKYMPLPNNSVPPQKSNVTPFVEALLGLAGLYNKSYGNNVWPLAW